jgi:hypothetical protein
MTEITVLLQTPPLTALNFRLFLTFTEEMAAASLDQNFKEELSAIEQCE